MTDYMEIPKILIVDDHPANIVALRRILKKTSLDLFEAESGQIALKLCQEHDFAVVLLDVIMPEIDGFDVAMQLRKNSVTRHMPILFITAYEMDSEQVIGAYDKLDAVDFIQKPINDRILMARINVFLRLYVEKVNRERYIVLLAEQKIELENEVKRRQKAEDQLRLSHENVVIRAVDRESRLQATMENALDAIVCINTTGKIVDFNPAAEMLFGYSREEVIGRDVSEMIIPPELRKKHRQGLSSYVGRLKAGQNMEGKKRMVDTLGQRSDGKKISLEVAISSFSCEDGTHITAFFRDITDRKQFSRALQGTLEVAEETHQELRRQKDMISMANTYTESIVNSMGDALIVLSVDGNIQRVNEPACQLLAGSEVDLLGKNISKFYSEGLLPMLKGSHEVMLCMDSFVDGINDSTSSTSSSDGRLLSQDGCKVPVLVSSSILRNTTGEEVGIILVAKDITEYKRSEDALREKEKQLLVAEQKAGKAKDQFLAHMSHEIRTPMNAIIGLTDQALLAEIPDTTRNYLEKVLNSSRFLMRIIDDLLDFSKIEAGKMELESIDFNLRELFNQLSDLFLDKALQKKIELTIHLPPKCPNILVGDPMRLEQVLMNLVSNAIKFTESGAIGVTVTVVEQRQGNVILMFAVRDTGIGMSQEHIEKLFQPFIQVDGSTSRKYGGTGLGLTICKRLVEKMGGLIQVQSTLGRGSNFQFSSGFAWRPEDDVPEEKMVQDYASKVDPAYFNEVTRKIGGARILLVEDSHINQQVAAEVLGNVGLVVQIVDNGPDAIRMVKSLDFDLVLMDIQMPGMDGLEATTHIRKLEKGKNLPIIAVTAHALEEDRQLCLAVGMDDHVPKPIDKKQLFDSMLELIPHREQPMKVPAEEKPKEGSGQSLPEAMVGIDVTAGVQRLDGNHVLYHSLLLDFANEFANVLDEVRSSMPGGEKEDVTVARRLVHSVKGMSGNLAATDLHIAASSLEKAITEDRQGSWPSLMESFTKAVNVVLHSIETLAEGEKPDVSKGKPQDIEYIEQAFNDLGVSIVKKRFKARKQLAVVKTKLGDVADSETMQLLETSIDKYDFDGAWQHLLALAAILDISIAGNS
jgi:PAS domain S-box-containing protein